MRPMVSAFLLALAVAAAPARASVIYAEDFEDGVFDGAVDGDSIGGLPGGTGLFHVTANAPASGSRALGFVRDETPGTTPNGTFANDGTGTIYSPEVLLSGGSSFALKFDVANFGRGDVFFDRFDIGVFVDGNHFVRASTFPDYAALGAQIYAQGAYQPIAVNIDEFIGQAIRVYIHYSVIAPTSGDFAGGRFDNLSIEADPEVAVAEPATAGLFALGLAGIAARRRRKRASAPTTC